MRTHVLFEGAPGVVVADDGLVIEGVEETDIVATAVRVAPRADRIELCGGMSVSYAADVVAAVGGSTEVRLNRYGFESLEQVAAYKTGFGTSDVGDAAFLYGAASSTPFVVGDGVMVAGVADDEALVERARQAREAGAGIIELYAGLGATAAALVRRATDGEIPVGFVD